MKKFKMLSMSLGVVLGSIASAQTTIQCVSVEDASQKNVRLMFPETLETPAYLSEQAPGQVSGSLLDDPQGAWVVAQLEPLLTRVYAGYSLDVDAGGFQLHLRNIDASVLPDIFPVAFTGVLERPEGAVQLSCEYSEE